MYGFGGFILPFPNSKLPHTIRLIPVVFGPTNSSGQLISSSTGAALAAAGAVKVTLTGPAGNMLTSAKCSWVRLLRVFTCALATPAGVSIGSSYKYLITASENVGGGLVTAPPYSTSAFDVSPEAVYFK